MAATKQATKKKPQAKAKTGGAIKNAAKKTPTKQTRKK
jgi:hypothetical protein